VHTVQVSTSRRDVAIIEVDETGLGTLRLGDEPVEHVAAAQPSIVVRVLLDYAATVGHDLLVLTRHSDGHSARHQLCPNGTAILRRHPVVSPQPTNRQGQSGRWRVLHRYARFAWRAANRVRHAVQAGWTTSRRWLVGHGLWLMLGAEILLLVGSLTLIVVVLAPYLWPKA
jgi:hypothetical protein